MGEGEEKEERKRNEIRKGRRGKYRGKMETGKRVNRRKRIKRAKRE